MFSFFRSKKHSPPDSDSSPSEPIPSGAPADDGGYIMIEQKGSQEDDTSSGGGNKLYPDFNAPYPFMYPPKDNPDQEQQSARRNATTHVHNLQDVPFSISKELILFETMDMYVAQMTEAIEYMSSKLNLDDLDYDFKLEKSLLEME